jgi:hypothetical protein
MDRSKKHTPGQVLTGSLDKKRQAVRGRGAWLYSEKDTRRVHYFVCKHPKSNVAVSLCWTEIQPIDKLTLPGKRVRCQLCLVFLKGRKEVVTADNKVLYKVRRIVHKSIIRK